MKFQPERLDGVNAIQASTSTQVTVNQQVWTTSVRVPWQGEITAWPCARVEDLTVGQFESLLALQPEVVIVGTGARHQFVSPRLSHPLLTRGIGVESMDTAAACRTYNILIGEGRRAVAVLLLD
ncbi:Mth938-like domain-containing protein [Leptothrix discophora]|uniref:Mth938-like domain-containing protein n=1 Tax=Leptothrix discophora TaxID=89 RepID=A0ABT9FYT8_LEPDI|nr:Mth938-like domain-containing protein [Leptothrix discophora]MDP4299406.1 Mth938-like domain-containing protein [Leptothrix discophora]